MRLLYIADGRSPTARNWIKHFITPGNEVHLISTSACEPLPGLASLQVLTAAFSGTGAGSGGENPGSLGRLRRMAPMGVRTFIRQWLGPLTLPKTVRRLRGMIAAIQPELVHAMRFPFEGVMAAQADPAAPLIVSVWGNDFTLHARSNPILGAQIKKAVRRADALHTDCQRDLRLAYTFGFPETRPVVVLPGSGGVNPQVFYPPKLPRPAAPIKIINPRGFRTYIRNDSFFAAIPLIRARYPGAKFVCPAAAHEAQAQKWVQEYGLEDSVELLPVITQGELAELFRESQIVISPSEHDGTPNTVLEALACGCFPVAGEIESIQEWLTDGENSLLFDPGNPQALAVAAIRAIEEPSFRADAVQKNLKMIAEKANYPAVMAQAEDFYSQVAGP